MKLDINRTVMFLIMAAIIPILTLASNTNVLFAIMFFIWGVLFIYAIGDMGNRSLLVAFLIAFFVFLIGRDMLENFGGYKVENFDLKVNNHAYVSMIISLLSIAFSYIFFSRKRTDGYEKADLANKMQDESVKKISVMFFYITIAFAIISKIVVAKYLVNNSYSELYTDYSEYLSGNTILYLISKIELMMPVSLCIYLASMPDKKEIKAPLCLYIFYLVISLGSGQRSTSMLGMLFLMVYILYRNSTDPEEGWFKKKYIVLAVILLPVLAVFLTWYNAWRFNELDRFKWYEGVFDFLYEQGVTSNVIKRGYMYIDQIPNDKLYVLEFMRSGLLARVFGIQVYHGNTIEHALYGGSYTHTLGYVVLRTLYLTGRGTGTSYIAELFQDFGYMGIVAGNVVYGYIMAKITNLFSTKSVFKFSVQLYIITQILWAPRGSFSGFLTVLFYPTTVITYILIFGVANIMNRRSR